MTNTQNHEVNDTWAPWRFLIGDWAGVGSGDPGQGEGKFSFGLELAGKILVRRNRTEFPPKAGEAAGAVHEDLLIVYPQMGSEAFQAIYFDNEGHTIQYEVNFPANAPDVVFESLTPAGAPRFRLVYEEVADGEVEIAFWVAPPGMEFMKHVSGLARRLQS